MAQNQVIKCEVKDYNSYCITVINQLLYHHHTEKSSPLLRIIVVKIVLLCTLIITSIMVYWKEIWVTDTNDFYQRPTAINQVGF